MQVQWTEKEIKASIINLLEDEIHPLACSNGTIELTFKPYEIKSVKLVDISNESNLTFT